MKINLSEWLVLIRPEVAGFEVTGDIQGYFTHVLFRYLCPYCG